MNSGSGKRRIWLVIIALIIVAAAIFAWVAYQFDQGSRQSERHDYTYSIDLSYTTTIDNVTLFLPVPELNGAPVLAGALVNGTGYGVPADWNLSIADVNGTPMLAIRAARMVPEYRGYPMPAEPGVSPNQTTLQPATEYSSTTPVLIPVHMVAIDTTNVTINTRHPLGHEPVFAPDGQFTPETRTIPPIQGTGYTHMVPVYVWYTSDRVATLSLHLSIQGTNSIWRGGWIYNKYEDTVTLEPGHGSGWKEGEGLLITGEGVYY